MMIAILNRPIRALIAIKTEPQIIRRMMFIIEMPSTPPKALIISKYLIKTLKK